jgi:GTPase SAR1 family protein
VGGQKTLRPYWRNYFESTDAVVWVVDSSDGIRMEDCKAELRGLLGEEVSWLFWFNGDTAGCTIRQYQPVADTRQLSRYVRQGGERCSGIYHIFL